MVRFGVRRIFYHCDRINRGVDLTVYYKMDNRKENVHHSTVSINSNVVCSLSGVEMKHDSDGSFVLHIKPLK